LDVIPISWRVEHFDQIDSTNTWMAEKARNGAPEGTVAYADFQSAGRGRLDRVWEAAAGSSLLCSLLLTPPLNADELSWAVACVALGARAALVRLCGVRPDIKWPNDLMVGEKKLAGLLAEVVATNDDLAVVVGIGVNLTARASSDERATNVAHEAGVTITPRALLDILLEEVEWRRRAIEDDQGFDRLREEYERALVTLGQTVRVETPHDIVVGEALGVDRQGRLVVLVDDAKRVFDVGDVVHVRAEGP
jgi:BirA family biotin operon repressor/biotin-[acetyl-CoA-carboxylase] ligase